MKWQDRGILVAIRKFGETDQLASFVTEAHGLASGLIKGGISRKRKPYLQIGNSFDIEWKSRLEEQLGFFNFEPVELLGASLFESPWKLAVLASCCGVLADSLAENTPHGRVFRLTERLIGSLSETEGAERILFDYMLWEKELLAELGFGLMLEKCNATGATEDLCYISPKTGRAICRAAGEPYKDRLLPMPRIWQGATPRMEDIAEALRVLEYFFERHVYSEKNKPYPYLRRTLSDGLMLAA
ncbi:MAG: DNA repair protein RecO [Rickettsiales bacterium]|jgi:DNA repair protein RecO (recombination protein O)|nr:DNA repair protein RecO [Rickettsiales bacterium]